MYFYALGSETRPEAAEIRPEQKFCTSETHFEQNYKLPQRQSSKA